MSARQVRYHMWIIRRSGQSWTNRQGVYITLLVTLPAMTICSTPSRRKVRIIRPSFETPTSSERRRRGRAAPRAPRSGCRRRRPRSPCRRAASAKRIGNRPLPASRPTVSARGAWRRTGAFVERLGTAKLPRSRDPSRSATVRSGRSTVLAPVEESGMPRSRSVESRDAGRSVLPADGLGRQRGRHPGDLRRELVELPMHVGESGDHLEEPALLADGDGRRAEDVLAARGCCDGPPPGRRSRRGRRSRSRP